jgi:neutral ceramidase
MKWTLLAVAALFASTAPASAGALKVGAGRFDITPPASIFPYDNGREAKFVGVHDPLFARAIVLDDGVKRIVIVAVDVTVIPRPGKIVARVAEAASIPTANVIITASHTHNAPLFSYHGGTPTPAQSAEMDRVEEGAAAAVQEALAKLQSARIASARGRANVTVNNGEAMGHTDGFDDTGISDKTLDVIRLEGKDGKPLALLVNHPTHAEVVFKSITRDGGIEVSGDLPGAVSQLLEKDERGAPVVLFTPGAEGDQKTLFNGYNQAGTLPANNLGAGSWALLEAQARRLTVSVLGVLGTMPAASPLASIGAASGGAICPGQKIRIDRATGKVTSEAQPNVTIPLTMIRVNNIALAGIGGDLGSEIGINIRKANPKRQTVLLTVTAGTVGYILADASYAKPGHGVEGSPLKPGCAQGAIIKGLAELDRKIGR